MDEKDSGFTLIELLVVMVIIGILAAIAIPLFLKQRQKGYDSQAKSDLRNFALQEDTYFTDNNKYGGSADVCGTAAVGACANIKMSKGTTITITAAQPSGWCASAVNSNGSGATYYYDSNSGGFQGTT